MEKIRSVAWRRELIQLAEKLGVKFNDLSLLQQALTHTSYANESKGNIVHNERLEFLGDAVLELASSTYLYQHFPNMPEGQLTKIRASIVCSQTLAKLARGLHLGDYLLLGHGEEMSGGRDRQTNLEDTFESIIGAIYLDKGWETACEYVMRQLKPEFKQVAKGLILKDYKSILQEKVYQHEGQDVAYELLETTGPDHNKMFTFQVRITGKVMGQGTGHSKKEAEQKAACEALMRLGRGSK